ncbi:MAG: nucleotidyl transferase AbiEii/AbiGii toxin family protein [Tannerellaceae bacterium]|nr:nucleotidyl transferase AbiEii/AbiGii toxin family protein [Tannerellaceae bacterium]
MLQTKTLFPSTLELLIKLQSFPLFSQLRLVGGTALALQLGHRLSVDLDFFGRISAGLQDILAVLHEQGLSVTTLHNTTKIHVFTINNIKVDFVDYPYPWLEDAIIENGIVLAGMKDIAAMKLSAITNRGTKKDFIDMYFLLQHFSLQEMIGFYTKRFNDDNIFPVIKSLSYFEDAEEEPMPKMLIPTAWEDVKFKLTEVVADISSFPQ